MANAEASPDLRARIASASNRVEIDALAKTGRRSVLVLPVQRLESLVREAVDRALAAEAGGRRSADVERIEADARRRLAELTERHRELLRLKSQAEEALSDLAHRIEGAGARGRAPDLGALARQVAAMAGLLRGEAPAVETSSRVIRDLLESLSAGAPPDDRLDRILYQLERLASSVEATERRMRAVAAAAPALENGRARSLAAGAPGLEIFRAILEENLRLTGAAEPAPDSRDRREA